MAFHELVTDSAVSANEKPAVQLLLGPVPEIPVPWLLTVSWSW